jgi:hypothetical protein
MAMTTNPPEPSGSVEKCIQTVNVFGQPLARTQLSDDEHDGYHMPNPQYGMGGCADSVANRAACAHHVPLYAPSVPSAETPALSFVDVVFDGPPSHESGRFIECEDARGHGIRAGEWIDRGNGYWALRIPTNIPAPASEPTEGVAFTEDEYLGVLARLHDPEDQSNVPAYLRMRACALFDYITDLRRTSTPSPAKLAEIAEKKCFECGKAHGGICAACHCHTPDRGNHWHLFEVAQRSFCSRHCREDWHHPICRDMTEQIGAQSDATKRELGGGR